MMLRRILTKQAVAEAEIQAVKQKKEASRIIQEMNKSKQNKSQQKKEAKSKLKGKFLR
jgi:F0F1-type ATP synthase epsilon subunit